MHGLMMMKKFNPEKPKKITKFTKVISFIKNNKTYVFVILISVLLYSVILGSFGVFGETIKNGLLYFIKHILPYILMAFGYFMVVFLPIRIIQALKRNEELQKEYEADRKLQELANKSKALQEKIINAMGNKGTF